MQLIKQNETLQSLQLWQVGYRLEKLQFEKGNTKYLA
jgi:hypothetical protein